MNCKPIFPHAFLFFFLILCLSAPIVSHGKVIRKKDNGQVITDAEWEQAVRLVQKKFPHGIAKGLKMIQKQPQRTQNAYLRGLCRPLREILKKNGFDWGKKSLKKYCKALLAAAYNIRGMEENASGGESPTGTATESTAAKTASQVTTFNSIFPLKQCSFSFSYRAGGNKGSLYQFNIRGTGLIVFANKLLSNMLSSGLSPESDTCDYYWIYPMHLSFKYWGKIEETSYIHNSIDNYILKHFTHWNFVRDFDLPLPEEDYNINEIEAWKAQVENLGQKQECLAYFVVFDRTPAGGDAVIEPHFAVKPEAQADFTEIKKGTQEGKPVSYTRRGKSSIGFAFNGWDDKYAKISYLLDKYGFYSKDPVIVTDSFHMDGENLFTRAGRDSYIPHWYKYFNRPPGEKVLSDSKFNVNYSYRLVMAYDIDGTIESAKKDWRPKGGDESNTITIKASLKDKAKKGYIRFTLYNVSREKGYAMNKGSDTGFDYEFETNQTGFTTPQKTSDGWQIETTEMVHDATVTIRARDYGAWARLKAQVKADQLWHDCEAEDGKFYITLPYDEDENRIADCWEEKYGIKGQAASSDNDPKPEEITFQTGDGFSNYEEYRGFFVNGSWTDTDPTLRDIFIYDEIGYGAGYFESSKIKIHLINEDEYDAQRVVNFNRGYATLKDQNGQKGLHLMEKADLRGYDENGTIILGEVEEVGTPNVVDWVGINPKLVTDVENSTVEHMIRGYDTWNEEMKKQGIRERLNKYATYTIPSGEHVLIDALSLTKLWRTIAHELGHAVNLSHHGDLDAEIDANLGNKNKAIAFQGGKWSGDVYCVMRYSGADYYCGKDGKLHEYPDDFPYQATRFCSSNKGTGFNANGQVCGDATCGACWKHITLKGYAKGAKWCENALKKNNQAKGCGN